MANTNMSLLVLVLVLVLASSAVGAHNQDLSVAISEMQRANYFTFTMLLNMISPSDHRFQGNMTFLMPNNRVLSNTTMQQNEVTEFLLRHSIPSPMLFDYLQHIPSGSIIPTSTRDYALLISNNGRKNFVLNNVKLISPNICTAGSLFRCHGIDGVLSLTENNNSNPNDTPSPSCVITRPPPPPAPLQPSPPLRIPDDDSPPSPVPQNSGSSTLPNLSETIFVVWLWIPVYFLFYKSQCSLVI